MKRFRLLFIVPMIVVAAGMGPTHRALAQTPTLQYEVNAFAAGCQFATVCHFPAGLFSYSSVSAENFRGVQAGKPDYLSGFCEHDFADSQGHTHYLFGSGTAYDAQYSGGSALGTINGWAGVNYPGVPAFNGADTLTRASGYIHAALTDPNSGTRVFIDGSQNTDNTRDTANPDSGRFQDTVVGQLYSYVYGPSGLISQGTMQGNLYCVAGGPGYDAETEYDYGDGD